ncbi:MAG: DAK2 domain-containing protein [Clostridia bacterium]|nr:DAK2 domain-containing protein [Clostridia bacterium]MBN2883715.1 DAK2 domain-containing protein [Clostridia bacterium]
MDKLKVNDMKEIFKLISSRMDENRDYLVELDSKAGDGDLGISMSAGFRAVLKSEAMTMESFKRFFMNAGMAINEASPSSLGTIMFMGLLGGAKKIADYEELGSFELGQFFEGWTEAIMTKTGSKAGEKTILDAVLPATESLLSSSNLKDGIRLAYEAAKNGMLSTIEMKAVHGRAAYYQEKSIGLQDGGATVGMLIFQAFNEYING